ncbi:E-set like domain [Vibrio sp. B1ASS3]|uniref:TcfC E-set like domain-containing protein n=1 Tax=Vibrio sp. B1ASS3 TaxID=2751176 RepID=UPI001ABA2B2C|nr:TcfC E-set like domain-containing protein [Vibrio sp. B1ASS3]CAD7827478.1 E-set like domain [Vibrio sp. B1ASS3]CAE6964674.1 E-set like domain [Vibrio sp. B1ASS3]
MNKLGIFLMLLTITSPPIQAYEYPEEFSDFFVETRQPIQIIVSGELRSIDVDAYINYESFRIEENSNSYHSVLTYLDKIGLKEEAYRKILHELVSGVSTDSGCEGKLDKCILIPEGRETKYIFDFDNSILKLFIPSTAIESNETIEFNSPYNKNGAVVNWMNVYGFTNLEGEENLSINSETTVGLPLGTLSFDSEYQLGENSGEVYKALYDVEYEDMRFQFGRERYNPEVNTTDYLNNGASYSGDAVRFASSANLLKGSSDSVQRIYFYAPANGQLEVYRDEHLILNKVVSTGKQFVSYSELPKGMYSVKLLLKVSGQIVLEERRNVVNNNEFSLRKGEIDYAISLGKLKRNTETDNEDYDGKYFSSLINYRLLENLYISGGITADLDSQYYQVGTTYMPFSNSRIEASGGTFSDGDYYFNANFSFYRLFADYRKFEVEKEKNKLYSLANQLYGESSRTEFGIGYNGDLLGGNGYVRYDWSNYDGSESSYFTTSYHSSRLASGWSYKLSKGRLDLNVGYAKYDSEEPELTTNISYVLDLSEDISTQYTVYTDNEGFEHNTNYITLNKKQGNWNSNTSLGMSIERGDKFQSELSSNISGHTKNYNLNAYGYIGEGGRKTFSTGISGTQILSLDGIDLTNEKGDSFVKVTRKSDINKEESVIKMSLKSDKGYGRSRELIEETTIVKLSEFNDIELILDNAGNNVEIEGKRLEAYILPGSFYKLESRINQLLSMTIIFDDVFGEPVPSLQCVGEGCVSVEPVTDDGVFRVNYKKNTPFRLVSKKGLCVYDEESTARFTKGYCLPGIDNQNEHKWSDSSSLLNDKNKNDTLVYLGSFNAGEEFRSIKDKLNKKKIVFKIFEVADSVFIYADSTYGFNQAQLNILKELDAYVLQKNATLDLLTLETKLGKNDNV